MTVKLKYTDISAFLLCKSKKSAIIGITAIVVLFAIIILHLHRVGIKVNPLIYLVGGAAELWNQMMIVIDALGFITPPQIGMNWYRSDYSAVFFLSLVSCFVYYLSVRKKTKLSLSSTFTLFLCAPLFIYNLPNNNVGICVLLAAATGFAAMRICEKHTADVSSSAHIGLAALLLSALLLIIPCSSVNRPWIRIDVISEKIELLRQIITDIAEGKSVSISDILSDDPTGDRNTNVENRKYRGTEMFRVYSDSNAPLYLRNWIGGEFSDNAWSAPDPERFDCNNLDAPYTVTEDFLALYAATAYWKPAGELASPDSTGEAYNFNGDPEELGLIYSDILIIPKKQTRLLAIPYMTVSPVTSPDGNPFSVGYERMKDGIYLTDKKLSDTTPYRIKALIPLSRTDDCRERLHSFMKTSHVILNEDMNAVLRNEAYTELADLLYGGIPDSHAVDQIVKDLFLTTEINQYYRKVPRRGHFHAGGNAVATITDTNGTYTYYPGSKTLLAADDIAHIVIDYLGEHYRYDLTPPAPSSDDSMEEFLLISKEGYCVQFATAATLIMRRLGFSARYVEGYIANNFQSNTISNDYTYECRVIDKNAHAWMEVWINGFGWMQYEVTPGFVEEVYSVSYSIDTAPDDPITTESEGEITSESDTTEKTASDNPPETSLPSVTTNDNPTVSKPTVATTSESSGKTPPTGNSVVLLALLAVLPAVSVAILLIGKRSSDKQKYRKKLLALALSADGKENASVGASLCVVLFDTLRAYGLVPGSSELPSAFAERADTVLSGIPLAKKPSEAIYAAENQIYGKGMTKEELHTAATVIIGLTSHAKTRLGTVRFIWNRYILCTI